MTSATSPCRWSAKRYILAALAGTLVLTAVVIVVSVVLSPAAIHFSITNTRCINSMTTSGGGKYLNLTLTANNTSHRAGVKYRSVIVSLLYTNASSDVSLPLDNVSPPSRQSPGSTASINVSASFASALLVSDFAGSGENATRIRVLVDTVVRFKYGRVYTRPYNIRVLCDPVDFFSPSPLKLPINCSDD